MQDNPQQDLAQSQEARTLSMQEAAFHMAKNLRPLLTLLALYHLDKPAQMPAPKLCDLRVKLATSPSRSPARTCVMKAKYLPYLAVMQ